MLAASCRMDLKTDETSTITRMKDFALPLSDYSYDLTLLSILLADLDQHSPSSALWFFPL